MIIAVDLDDVLCTRPIDKENLGVYKYYHCRPIQKNINIVNRLSEFHKIIIYTARGMSQFNGDVDMVKEHLYQFTYGQLVSWDVKFDKLIMGKIHYDLLIDDKVLNSKGMDLYFEKRDFGNLSIKR